MLAIVVAVATALLGSVVFQLQAPIQDVILSPLEQKCQEIANEGYKIHLMYPDSNPDELSDEPPDEPPVEPLGELPPDEVPKIMITKIRAVMTIRIRQPLACGFSVCCSNSSFGISVVGSASDLSCVI